MSASLFLRRALPRAQHTRSVASFAKMTIVGRLADTPEVLATSTGQEIVKYAVGTNSGPRDNQKTSWFRVTSFSPEGPGRDFLASLEKGTLVYVEGDASMSSYNDAEGKPKTSLNLVQRRLEVLSPKKTADEGQYAGSA